MTFGEWLTRRMVEKGFTTTVALANATGLDNSTISRWRRDHMTPDPDQLRKLARPLDTPMLQLLVLAGLVSRDEARLRPQTPSEEPAAERRSLEVVRDQPDDPGRNEVIAAILRDPFLLPEAKAHFLNQYELLLRIHQPQENPLPYVAHGQRTGPVDPEQEARIEEAARRAAERNPDSPRGKK